MSNPIDLNQLRRLVHQNQSQGATDPKALPRTVVVDRDARIHLADKLDPTERQEMSVVQQDTFHAPTRPSPIDLNQLRRLVHQNQLNGTTNPSALPRTVVVDRDARIHLAEQLDPAERQEVSVVQQDTFHGTGVPAWFQQPVAVAADGLGAEVMFCGPQVWKEIPLLATELALPGGISLLVLGGQGFPGLPPLVFLTEGERTEQLNLPWELEVPAEKRLLASLRSMVTGDGPFRTVYGPSAEWPLTEDPAIALEQGWKRFLSRRPLRAAAVAEDLFSRSGGFLTKELSKKSVLLVGLGSGGSYVAEQLVRAGVGSLTLIDPDEVETHNLSRTSYRIGDVGQAKTVALSRLLRSIRPDLQVEVFQSVLGKIEPTMLEERIVSSDLVLGLTDDPSAQSLLNQLAWRSGRPAIFAGLYRAAAGGEVVLSLPGETPCYRCATGGIRESTPAELAPDIDYGSGRLTGETALAADIQHLDSATVKLSLALLSRDLPGAALGRFLEEPLAGGLSTLCLSMTPNFWFFPTLFAETAGQYAYQGVWFQPERDPACTVCGAEPGPEIARNIPEFDPATFA